MKKEKMNRVSKFMLAVCLLTASSGGIAWGQAYIGTDMNAANNVNNEFGAGESSTINNGQIIVPGTQRPISSPPAFIWLGSTSAKNIVINSYNSGGLLRILCIMDWPHGIRKIALDVTLRVLILLGRHLQQKKVRIIMKAYSKDVQFLINLHIRLE